MTLVNLRFPGMKFLVIYMIVERFARPGQVVCDPVLLDRSSIALAARRHGCIFIGAGTDQSCINRIRDRLARAEGDGTP